MAPTAKLKPIEMYCPTCMAPRRGESLIIHCIDKHDGMTPIMVRVKTPREFAKAVKVLRMAGVEVLA